MRTFAAKKRVHGSAPRPSCTRLAPTLQSTSGKRSIQRLLHGDPSGTAAPPIVHEVLSSPGQSLDSTVRRFMEPRFGRDFGQVRVHADARAAESAEAVNARAFTTGQDVVFGAGQYQPGTDTGRQLLAHELSHTVQQGPAGLEPRVQRSMKFEFQTGNKVTTDRGRAIGRKYGGFLHKGKSGVELQTDTGGVVEFETAGWFRKWSKLKKRIKEAVEIVDGINAVGGKGFPFNAEKRLRKAGLLKTGEKLEVKIRDATFTAQIQSSESLALSQYGSFLKEHETAGTSKAHITRAQRILDAGRNAHPTITPASTDNLLGFLQLIVNYLRRGQAVLWQPSKKRWDPVKATFRLMHRTDFSSMFSSLLSKDEKALFKEIVKDGTILSELKLSATDPFFKEGYWGHHKGMMALFKSGKIVALGNSNNNRVIHDCASTVTTTEKTRLKKDEHIDIDQCGKSVAGTEITVGGWLESILRPPKGGDLLSPPVGGSAAMGRYPVLSKKKKEKGLARFETRGTAGHSPRQPAANWVDYVEEVFLQAATCRSRAGTGTELIYDGSKTFDSTKCP
jgi:hypothetical protein